MGFQDSFPNFVKNQHSGRIGGFNEYGCIYLYYTQSVSSFLKEFAFQATT